MSPVTVCYVTFCLISGKTGHEVSQITADSGPVRMLLAADLNFQRAYRNEHIAHG